MLEIKVLHVQTNIVKLNFLSNDNRKLQSFPLNVLDNSMKFFAYTVSTLIRSTLYTKANMKDIPYRIVLYDELLFTNQDAEFQLVTIILNCQGNYEKMDTIININDKYKENTQRTRYANAAHGDKRENRAWNAVELHRFVEIKFNELQNCDDYIYDDSVMKYFCKNLASFYKYSEALGIDGPPSTNSP
ncbi:hypothetical protein H8356DRAFT_1428456 [Neocallimastix lanati (nom. inval.)]|nr:hypothetical protein H8356DRAFT_1428456 [Neocallimastix sp. JGI-2020a]